SSVSKFLGRGTRVSLALNKRNRHWRRGPSERWNAEPADEGKTGFIRLNDLECQALQQRIGTVCTDSLLASDRGEGGGCMLYEFIAANDRISFSNDTLIIFSCADARPRSRAPDPPLSTR